MSLALYRNICRVVLPAVLLVMLGVSAAVADDYTVTNTNDSGVGSLREAVTAAYNRDGADTIEFASAVTGAIVLTGEMGTNTALAVTDDLTINGPGADRLTLKTDGSLGIFEVESTGALTISGLTLSDGSLDAGGAINSAGDVTMTDCAVINNYAQHQGGGVMLAGGGTGVFERCTFSGNTAGAEGGAIAAVSAALRFINCTISGNSGQSSGGGIYVNSSPLSLVNCTVTGNDAAEDGGGVYHIGSDVALKNSIVAGNTDGLGFPNLSGNSLSVAESGANITSGDPLLGTLADNGGPTRTHALLEGSPAIDAGAIDINVTVDQRGVDRPQGDAPDIGAFELEDDDNQAPYFTSSPLTGATVAQIYSYEVQAGDDASGETLTITAPTLPDWLTFTDNEDGSGVLAGRPAPADVGEHDVVLQVQDEQGLTGEQSFTIAVREEHGVSIVSEAPSFATTNLTYTYRVRAESNSGAEMTLTAPTLPGWLNFEDRQDGAADLWGTPTDAVLGGHDVTIKVVDAAGETDTQSFTVEVQTPPDPPPSNRTYYLPLYVSDSQSTHLTAPVLRNVSEETATVTFTLRSFDDGQVLYQASLQTPPGRLVEGLDSLASVLQAQGALNGWVELTSSHRLTGGLLSKYGDITFAVPLMPGAPSRSRIPLALGYPGDGMAVINPGEESVSVKLVAVKSWGVSPPGSTLSFSLAPKKTRFISYDDLNLDMSIWRIMVEADGGVLAFSYPTSGGANYIPAAGQYAADADAHYAPFAGYSPTYHFYPLIANGGAESTVVLAEMFQDASGTGSSSPGASVSEEIGPLEISGSILASFGALGSSGWGWSRYTADQPLEGGAGLVAPGSRMSYCPIQAGTARNFRISPFLHIPGYQDGHFVKLVNPNDQEASAVLTWRNEDGDKTVQTETVGAFGGKRIMPPASLSTRSGKVDLEVSSSVGLVGMGFFGPTALIPPIMTGRSAMEAGLGGMTSEMADIFNREIEPALVSEAGGAGLTVEDYSITTDFDSRLASLMDSGLTEAQARAILESGTVGDLRNALREAYGQQTPEGLIPLVSPASFSITFEADGAGSILPFAAPFNFLPELAGRTAASAACYKMQAGGGLLRYGDYASSASLPQEDGAWCLLTENGRYLRPTDVVEEGRSYRIKLYIADNGPYDNNDQVGIIADPFTVGISEDQPAQTSGGGGGAVGCFVGSAAE